MSNTTVQYTSVNPESVRKFAKDNGLAVGSRGLFSAAVQKAYNKGKKKDKQYNPSAVYVPHVTVTAKAPGKPPVRRTIPVPVIREAAEAAGVTVGKRGRVPESVAKAYVLGTLGQ